MSNLKLELSNYGVLDMSKDIPLALNFNLNDIIDIRNRGGVWSKTIKLPSTNNNNDILGDIFNVNIQALTFNQQVKEPIRIIVDGFIAFEGVFQVHRVNKVYKNSQDFKVEYDCYIKSEVSSFYNEISGKYLNDLDLSEFNHNWDIDVVLDSMSGGTWIDGYQYFLAYNQDDDAIYEPKKLIPSTYSKVYWDKIIANAGYTYEWGEANDLNFDKMVIPFNGEQFKPLPDILWRFRAGTSTERGYLGLQVDSPSALVPANITAFTNTIIYDNDISQSESWTDPNDVWNTANGRFSLDDFSGSVELNAKYTGYVGITPSGVTSSNVQTGLLNYDITVNIYTSFKVYDINDVLLATLNETLADSFYYGLNSPSINANTVNNGGNFSVDNSAVFNSQLYPTASYISFNTRLENINDPGYLGYFSPNNNWYDTSFEVVVPSQNNDTGFITSTPDYSIREGSPVNMNSLIPNKISQSDFVLSFIKLNNLYIIEDSYNPTNLIIKTRDKFYSEGGELDWTDKVNIESVNIELISNKQKKRKLFTYKSDSKDDVSKEYTNQTNEVYGQLEFIFQSDFTKGTEKIEPIFSPTFSVTSAGNGSVNSVPFIDCENPKNNIRLLVVGDILTGKWLYGESNTGSTVPYTDYRYVGHLYPNPSEPTYDSFFGVCDYYSHDYISVTDNNLYNNHYTNQMRSLNEGHLLTAYFNLTYLDVANLDFNERIYVQDSWWYINKIIDFDLNNRKLTKVELISADLKITSHLNNDAVAVANTGKNSTNKGINDSKTFSSDGSIIGVGVANVISLGDNTIQDRATSSLALGKRNDISGKNNQVIGSYNSVTGSNNLIQGTDNIVLGDNITAFGVSGETLSGSNTTYVNNLVVTSSSAQDKTYQELADMVTTSGLSVGSYYYMTDYETIYDRPDYTGTTAANGVILTVTGSSEPLLLMAISNTEFSDEVFSPTYPDDYIRYEFGYDSTYVNSSPAKGRIIERRGDNGNRTDYDHRAITFKRYDRSGDLTYVWYWDSGSDNSIFVDVFGANCNNIVMGNSVIRMENEAQPLNLPNTIFGDDCFNVVMGDYSVNNTFGDTIQSSNFNSNHYGNQYGDTWIYNVLGDGYRFNIFGSDYRNNNFGQNFQLNTFGDTFNHNTFGQDYDNVTLGDTYTNNSFGNGYEDITMGDTWSTNRLGDYYFDNTFGATYAGNIFGQAFTNSTFGAGYTYNNFGNYISDSDFGDTYNSNVMNNIVTCTFGDSYTINELQNISTTTCGNAYTYNNMKYGMVGCTLSDNVTLTESLAAISSVDFTAGATIIYATYYKKFIKTSSGNLKLWTINDAGTSTMNNPTA